MIGQRVRLAREASQLTQQELADAAGITQAAVSQIEAGQLAHPSDAVIEGIARATLHPVGFFHLGPLPDLPEGHYRRLKRGASRVDRQVRAHVRSVVDLIQRSEGQLRLPPVRLEPRRTVPDLESVEGIAAETRMALGLGAIDPIPNLTRAVERAGVVVVRLPHEMPDHDAFSAWPDFGMDGRPIIAITGGHPGDRDRANVAHELGHLVLHTLRTTLDPDLAEAEAWRFAGALLFPREAAEEMLVPPVTLRVLIGVKATFGISIAFGSQRARDLGIISQAQFVSLRKQLAVRRWTQSEPVEVPRESPLLITKVLNLLAGNGSITTRAERISMPLFTFRALVT
jgi:Zn-dependent peptidase ImmA (M78 family)/transcriptional regulator with XRE-family HTH domain